MIYPGVFCFKMQLTILALKIYVRDDKENNHQNDYLNEAKVDLLFLEMHIRIKGLITFGLQIIYKWHDRKDWLKSTLSFDF